MAALSASRLVWSAMSLISSSRRSMSLIRPASASVRSPERVTSASACSRLSRVSAVCRATSSTVSAMLAEARASSSVAAVVCVTDALCCVVVAASSSDDAESFGGGRVHLEPGVGCLVGQATQLAALADAERQSRGDGDDGGEADDEDGAIALTGHRRQHGTGRPLGDEHPVEVVDDVVAADQLTARRVGESGRARLPTGRRLAGRRVVDRRAQGSGCDQGGVVGDLAHCRVVDQPVLAVDCHDRIAVVQLRVEQLGENRRVEVRDRHALRAAAVAADRLGQDPLHVTIAQHRRRHDRMSGHGAAKPRLPSRHDADAGPAGGSHLSGHVGDLEQQVVVVGLVDLGQLGAGFPRAQTSGCGRFRDHGQALTSLGEPVLDPQGHCAGHADALALRRIGEAGRCLGGQQYRQHDRHRQ